MTSVLVEPENPPGRSVAQAINAVRPVTDQELAVFGISKLVFAPVDLPEIDGIDSAAVFGVIDHAQ